MTHGKINSLQIGCNYMEKVKLKQPKVGEKIIFTKPTKWHWFTNVIEDEKLLEVGKEYTVKKVEIASSASYVYLEEFWDDTIDEYYQNQKMFNMHAFAWDGFTPRTDDTKGFSLFDIIDTKEP